MFKIQNVTGTNLNLTERVPVSYMERCLQVVTQDYASSLQSPFDKIFLKLVASSESELSMGRLVQARTRPEPGNESPNPKVI